MLQGFIVLLAVVTFVLMAADPRDSGHKRLSQHGKKHKRQT